MRIIDPYKFGVGLPAPVQAFLTATGISDPTITTALVNLYNALDGGGIWSKLLAIYPLVGGTAGTHKFNFKDPQDTDAAFRLTYTGGSITHNASGMTGGGSGNYADTHLVPGTHITTNEGSLGAWLTSLSPSGLGSNFSDMGCRDTGNKLFLFTAHWSDDQVYFCCNGAQSSADFSDNFTPDGSGEGFVQCVRQNSGNQYLQVNAVRVTAASAYDSPTRSAYLMAENLNGTPSFNSTRTFKFAYLGNTLTTTNMDALFTAVDAFQTDLGR